MAAKNHYLPYASRLRGVAAAASTVLPTNEKAKALKVTAAALEATVRVGAHRSAMELIDRARVDVRGLKAEEQASLADACLVDAFREDAREALNRLANMIRRNDPDPSDPPRGGS